MIYSTIPSKYLYDDLKEIFNNLKRLNILISYLSEMRNDLSEELLECENDGEAYKYGVGINKLSSLIKNDSLIVDRITGILCKEEDITKEECTNRINSASSSKIIIKHIKEITLLGNEIKHILVDRMSKRYPDCLLCTVDKKLDGTCPT